MVRVCFVIRMKMLPNRTSALLILLAGVPLLASLNRAHGRTVSLAFTIEHRASERAFQFDQLVHATRPCGHFRLANASAMRRGELEFSKQGINRRAWAGTHQRGFSTESHFMG